jgi:quercetin dioxygenase-like cupin family protein
VGDQVWATPLGSLADHAHVAIATNHEEEKMNRKRGAFAAALITAVAIGVNVVPSWAQNPPPPPIAPEVLTPRSAFVDDIDLKVKIKLDGRATNVVNVGDPSRTVVVKYTVQPDAEFPWHTHAGPVFVNIVEGALTYIDAETCNERTYYAGQAFVDPGQGHVHSAYNPGNAPMVLVATFFDAPEAPAPLLIPAADPMCS